MKEIIVISALLGIIFLNVPKLTLHTAGNRRKTIDTSKVAILKFRQSDTGLFKDAMPADLTNADIKDVDRLIKQAVLKYNKKSKYRDVQIRGKLSGYYKQLIAVVNNSGEKLVWVNCMCEVSEDPEWKKRIYKVFDGGTCFFRLKINLTKKETYDFYVNGLG